MTVEQWVAWAFQGVITGAIIYGVGEIKGLRGSIESLNAQLATIIEKTTWHQKELDRHEERIHALESKKGG